MQAFSATQAISPAINRTKSLLFQPFRWGTFLKLCTVAVLTEGSSGNFNSSHRGFPGHRGIGTMPSSLGFSLNPALIAAIIAIALLVLILGFVIFYLIVRLRFALFECLAHQTTLIAPGWHKYRAQAWRFFLLSIVVGIVFAAVAAAVLLPFGLGIWHVFQQSQGGGQFPVAGFLAMFLPLLVVILLIVVAAVCVDIILRDFMLPHIALDNASAGQAWAAARARIAHETGQFLLYGLLRVFVPVAAVVALTIVLFLPCLIVFGMLAAAMFALYTTLINGATAAIWTVIGWAAEVILGLIILALGLLLVIGVGGPLNIAIRNYALQFYGGRYQALGDILSPPPAAPPAMQPGIA